MEREWRFQFGLSTKPGDDPGIRVGISYLAGVVSPEVRAAWSWEESLRTVLSLVYLDRKWDGTIRGMIDELADRGAHVAKPGQCKRVFVDRGTLVGVQMGDRSKMISAAAGICGMRSGTLHSLVSEGAGEAPRAAGWWFEMRFECEVPAVPAGVTRRMVYVEEGAPTLEILREESGVFRLRTILPMEPSTLGRGFQRRLCERMMRVAGRLIPDLEYNVRKMVPDLRDAERVEGAELPALVPYENLDQIPVARRLCGHPGARGVLAGFSNLHPVNDETLPGLGALGAYRSAVSLFDAFSKKRDPGMMIPSIPSAGLA
ncbi:MAG: hypothetical protein EBX52_12155 [Proteobacteria bacterium]|nr:hypothetical protein [Pseudomonadota bacterium]